MKYEISEFYGIELLGLPLEPSNKRYFPEFDDPIKNTAMFLPPYTNSSMLLIIDLSTIWSFDKLMGKDLHSDVKTSLMILP